MRIKFEYMYVNSDLMMAQNIKNLTPIYLEDTAILHRITENFDIVVALTPAKSVRFLDPQQSNQ